MNLKLIFSFILILLFVKGMKTQSPDEYTSNILVKYSPMLSFNKPVFVSSQVDGYNASNAVDYDLSTSWKGVSDSSEWIYVDLLNPKRPEKIPTFEWIGLTGLDTTQLTRPFYIESSLDAIIWTTLWDASNVTLYYPNAYRLGEFQFPLDLRGTFVFNPPVSARYVRLNITSTENGQAASLAEFDIRMGFIRGGNIFFRVISILGVVVILAAVAGGCFVLVKPKEDDWM